MIHCLVLDQTKLILDDLTEKLRFILKYTSHEKASIFYDKPVPLWYEFESKLSFTGKQNE